MKFRPEPRLRVTGRLRQRLRTVALVSTFALLAGSLWFLYDLIGNVTYSRAQQAGQEQEPPPGTGNLEGYAGRKQLVINPEVLPGKDTLNDFPVFVTLRFDELRHATHGGLISSHEAGDLLFTAADGSTPLPHQVERFDPATGKLSAWVRVPQLVPDNAGNTLYMYYGNTAAVSSVSSETFSGPYLFTWHFNRNLLSSGPVPVAGEYRGIKDEEGRFAGAKDFLPAERASALFGRPGLPGLKGDISVSAWIRTRGSDQDQVVFTDRSKKGGCSLLIDKDGKAVFELRNGSKTTTLRQAAGGRVLEPGKWHSITGVYNSQTDSLSVYVDGRIDRAIRAGIPYTEGGALVIGSDAGQHQGYFNGIIDELRVANRAFDQHYIQTLYTSESAPEAFFRIDGQEVFSASPKLAEISRLEAHVNAAHVSVNWQTTGESNLDYFTVERSTDGHHFEMVATTFAGEPTAGEKNYFLLDPAPVFGNAYYRLRYTSFKGESDVSNILNVHYQPEDAAINIRRVDPNPFKDTFSVSFHASPGTDIEVKLTSISGQVVHTGILKPGKEGQAVFEYRNAQTLHPGIYFLNLSQAEQQKTVKLIKRI